MIMPETRIVLKNCGKIDARDIESYLVVGGFEAWKKARKQMTPDEVVTEVRTSELRGRGGAGYPCGLKWELAKKEQSTGNILICNADEGEVGAFKDRYLLQHDPYSVVEGIAICAYAIGSSKAYIYLRGEYHCCAEALKDAIRQAERHSFLGDLNISITEGAGAYICGEETALLDSIEGKRGEPRYRPPFPVQRGLWNQPTVVNNVETLANIPHIILHGAEWFREMGTERSKGTKVFSVSGDVERPGVYELALGTSLKELIVDLCGAEDIKMVQVGGATGGILPYSRVSTPLSYETVLGSGAVIVLNRNRQVLDFIFRTMDFVAKESCGKCTPCREGTEAMLEILERLASAEGRQEDIQAIEDLASTMMLSSLCGLGQAAAMPVLDTLKFFREEYETRIKQSILIRSLKG
jgi:NADH:ubiquinone oxidoreductase subunit F (NADH-binding)